MHSFPLRADQVPIVIAGLEALAQEVRGQPSAGPEETSLLEEQVDAANALADELHAWLMLRSRWLQYLSVAEENFVEEHPVARRVA